jgi:hypothetical protein
MNDAKYIGTSHIGVELRARAAKRSVCRWIISTAGSRAWRRRLPQHAKLRLLTFLHIREVNIATPISILSSSG